MTHRLQFAWIVVLVGVCSILFSMSAVAGPRARQARTLVLPLKVRGLPLKQARSMGKIVAKTMISELKQLHFLRLVAGKAVSRKLKKLKKKKILVKNCHADRKCIRSVGRRFKVKVIFSLHLTKADNGVSIAVRAMDVRSGKQIREAIEFSAGGDDDVKRATRWAVLKASSPIMTSLLKGKGRLEVRCSEDDALLYLNGKSFGARTNKSFKVGAGVFDIQVKKDGFRAFHDVVMVKPGQSVKVEAVMQSTGPKKVPVIATAPAAEQPKKITKPTEELPAWAVFEKKSNTPSRTQGDVAVKNEPSDGASNPPRPFLPGEQDTMDTPVDKIDDDNDRWYTTWWFWTAVGVAAAGGLAGGLYGAGVFDGSGNSSATGAAAITWQ